MYAAVLGAVAGLSVAPVLRALVVRHAVPQETPPCAACPDCGRAVRVLPPTGRCPGCRGRLGPRAGLVEAAAAVAAGVAVAAVPTVLGPAAFWVACLGVVLAFTDVGVRRLPYPLTGTLTAGLVPLLALAALVDGTPGVLVRCLLVALVAGALFELPAWFGLVGGGDSPLAFSLGALLGWFGWGTALTGLFATCLLAGVWGVVRALAALLRRRPVRGIDLAVGPFLLLGTLLALLPS